MKLLKFITYCKLKGMVATHTEVFASNDNDEKLFRIVITNDDHRATIMYKTMGHRAKMVASQLAEHLYNENPALQKTHSRISLKRIQEFFIPNEHT